MAANDRITNMTPEVKCLQNVQRKGFISQFSVSDDQLVCVSTGRLYEPREINIVNFYRFEGISDPGDMSILYVIETIDGQKGTLIDAFGIYAQDSVGKFFDRVMDIQKQTKRGWN